MFGFSFISFLSRPYISCLTFSFSSLIFSLIFPQLSYFTPPSTKVKPIYLPTFFSFLLIPEYPSKSKRPHYFLEFVNHNHFINQSMITSRPSSLPSSSKGGIRLCYTLFTHSQPPIPLHIISQHLLSSQLHFIPSPGTPRDGKKGREGGRTIPPKSICLPYPLISSPLNKLRPSSLLRERKGTAFLPCMPITNNYILR